MEEESRKILEQCLAAGLYEKLVHQLNKDFLRAGIKQEFAVQLSPISLSRNLVATIYELLVTQFEVYLSLLYAIDIPEKTISGLPDQRVDQMATSISTIILKREWQKVHFRENQ